MELGLAATGSTGWGLLRHDGVNLSKIGAPWPHPDKMRSTYTIAYLSLAAERNLAPLFQEYGIGEKVKDWELRHPKIPFHAYSVSAEDVAQVARARRRLFGPGVKQPDEPLLGLYRKGEASRVADAE